ncbi:hypothetical protein IKE88_02370 [Candidatus Saccharibacteria bacterium]|nr:hypothetical protein [Candidatus Saccharibacteria bacterium]
MRKSFPLLLFAFLTPLVALVQDLIHCRMYILATITGIRVGFTARR